MSGPETNDLRLGFIPLSDAAPLIVAREHGFFEEEGLRVELSREASWANIRDRVASGALDGGHMLAPMTLAASMGVGGERTPMTVPLALNLNGAAVTVSKALAGALRAVDPAGMAGAGRTAVPLARLIAARRDRGQPVLTFAVVFPYSIHAYALRYWLAAGGVDPDRDLRLVVAPPQRMAERLAAGKIDGFCVGAPWSGLSVSQGVGEVLLHASDIWRMGPDKVFGLTRAWGEANPQALQAAIRALLKAAAWADRAENRPALARLLAQPAYLDAHESLVRQSLMPVAPGEPAPIVYSRHAAGFPWRSHALWFLTQMLRWGQIGPEVDLRRAADAVYRPDLYRQAAASLALAAPLADDKPEGEHDGPWVLEDASAPIPMAADRFFDGRVFDPRDPLAYVRDFAISRLGG
ncbi:MAG TPA: CmpA/NrtA family ABC transporter substrate-binding protein [Caulobacter sp.]|nr:CmpA/NrtA family ABC transporter substrate-binding protein [Caulobacter sp.]